MPEQIEIVETKQTVEIQQTKRLEELENVLQRPKEEILDALVVWAHTGLTCGEISELLKHYGKGWSTE